MNENHDFNNKNNCESIIGEIEKCCSLIQEGNTQIKKGIGDIGNLAYHYFPKSSLLNFDIYRKFEKAGFGELQILCEKYGSDKGSIFSMDSTHVYKWMAHTYADFYEMIFAPIRSSIKFVFECGLGTNNVKMKSNMGAQGCPGASLYIWKDYFRSSIINVFGADIDKDILFSTEIIKTGWMDQTDPDAITAYFRNVGNIRFDIMIDDGLHTANAALTLFENSISYLAPNGLYFIEDMPKKYLLSIYDYLSEKDFHVNYIMMPRGASSDNSLIMITRPQTL